MKRIGKEWSEMIKEKGFSMVKMDIIMLKKKKFGKEFWIFNIGDDKMFS